MVKLIHFNKHNTITWRSLKHHFFHCIGLFCTMLYIYSVYIVQYIYSAIVYKYIVYSVQFNFYCLQHNVQGHVLMKENYGFTRADEHARHRGSGKVEEGNIPNICWTNITYIIHKWYIQALHTDKDCRNGIETYGCSAKRRVIMRRSYEGSVWGESG